MNKGSLYANSWLFHSIFSNSSTEQDVVQKTIWSHTEVKKFHKTSHQNRRDDRQNGGDDHQNGGDDHQKEWDQHVVMEQSI